MANTHLGASHLRLAVGDNGTHSHHLLLQGVDDHIAAFVVLRAHL